MNKFKAFAMKCGCLLSTLALIVGISSVDSACYLFIHQPKVPEAMNRFKK